MFNIQADEAVSNKVFKIINCSSRRQLYFSSSIYREYIDLVWGNNEFVF